LVDFRAYTQAINARSAGRGQGARSGDMGHVRDGTDLVLDI
jgi:hypothetical protein